MPAPALIVRCMFTHMRIIHTGSSNIDKKHGRERVKTCKSFFLGQLGRSIGHGIVLCTTSWMGSKVEEEKTDQSPIVYFQSNQVSDYVYITWCIIIVTSVYDTFCARRDSSYSRQEKLSCWLRGCDRHSGQNDTRHAETSSLVSKPSPIGSD